jgi:WD40-like Beta Propeller Repeat
MRSAITRAAAALAVLTASAAAATPAQAEILGTFEISTNVTPVHIGLKKADAGTGAASTLPAGVNTDAHELHASLSPDRKRMVFARKDSAAGTNRIIVVDLATGQMADLFSGFEASADPPTTPIFSLDGTKVITGRRLEHRDPNTAANALQASFTETSLANFPNGPFPHTIVDAGGPSYPAEGRTLQPAFSASGRFAYTVDFASSSQKSQTAVRSSPTSTFVIPEGAFDIRHPTMSETAGVVLFERRTLTGTQLAFRPLSNLGAATVTLPAIVNPPNAEVTRPALTADGRYLGFVRRTGTGIPKLFVWDTQTQLLLNDQGVGANSTAGDPATKALERDEGNVALEIVPVFGNSSVNLNTSLDLADIRFTLNRRSDVGIIVQRIVGQTRVLGRRAPKLKLVGRVPLGHDFSARRGGHRAPWNLRVNGRKLAPGDYLITPRSITRKGRVRDLGRARRLHIR